MDIQEIEKSLCYCSTKVILSEHNMRMAYSSFSEKSIHDKQFLTKQVEFVKKEFDYILESELLSLIIPIPKMIEAIELTKYYSSYVLPLMEYHNDLSRHLIGMNSVDGLSNNTRIVYDLIKKQELLLDIAKEGYLISGELASIKFMFDQYVKTIRDVVNGCLNSRDNYNDKEYTSSFRKDRQMGLLYPSEKLGQLLEVGIFDKGSGCFLKQAILKQGE